MAGQELQHLARHRTKPAAVVWRGLPRYHPVGLVAHKKSNGRDAGGDDSPASVPPAAFSFMQSRGMRRQSPPANNSGKAKLIEDFGIVSGNPAREHITLPGVGWHFKSL